MLTKAQQKIVQTIRRLQRRGEPLNITAVKRRHSELMAAVYAVKPFWGWKRALEAAGISYADIQVELKDFCVCEICKIRRKHLGMHIKRKHGTNADEYRMDYPDSELLCETLRLRRSKKGDRELPHWEPLWSAEYVLDRLWERYEKGLPINLGAVSCHDKPLLSEATVRFGSYNDALSKLGLDPLAIRVRPVPMTRQEALAGIVRRRRLYLSLFPYRVQVADSRLYTGAKYIFGSWQKAVEAAGLDYEATRKKSKYATRESVIREIKRRQRRGLSVNTGAITQGEQRDPPLYPKGVEFFGSWQKAVEAAGIRYRHMPPGLPQRYPTKEAVIAEIRRRRKAGLPLRSTDIKRGPHQDVMLLQRAYLLFSASWVLAVERAGFSYAELAPRGLYPTRQSVLEAIKRRRKEGLPLNAGEVNSGRPSSDRTLYSNGLKFFGRWWKAVEAAGIRYRTVAPVRHGKYPTKNAVVAEIQRRQRAHLPIKCSAVCKAPHADHPLCWSARRFFGKWARAVERAGFSYKAVKSAPTG